MSIHQCLFSSRSEEWPTPQSFYDVLNKEFNFSLDACATAENAKCRRYFTKEDDGLTQHWGTHRVFCNPPYGKTMLQWAHKCFDASQSGATVALLAHARTDTRWFHQWVYGKAAEIRFVRGRLRFGDGTQSAPFPSLVAVFRPPVGIGSLFGGAPSKRPRSAK
jgi:phage N-6-adenine-methyltransferase